MFIVKRRTPFEENCVGQLDFLAPYATSCTDSRTRANGLHGFFMTPWGVFGAQSFIRIQCGGSINSRSGTGSVRYRLHTLKRKFLCTDFDVNMTYCGNILLFFIHSVCY